MIRAEQIEKIVHLILDGNSLCEISKSEAIQLAKDLLMACGISGAKYIVDLPGFKTASESLVHSGMSLDEIQSAADQMGTDRLDSPYLPTINNIVILIANLAARVKEQVEAAEKAEKPPFVLIRRDELDAHKCSNCGYEG